MEHFFIRKKFFDFDEFSHVVHAWDLDFHQLDMGKCEADMFQFASSRSLLSNAKFNRQYDQRGSAPSGKWTFVLFSEQTPSIVWHDKEISNNTIIVFKPGSEIDCVSRPGFENFTLSYSEEYLNELCANLGLPGINKLANGNETFECSMLELSNSRQDLRQVIDSLENNFLAINNSSLIHTVDVDFPEQILLTLARSVPIKNESLRVRKQVVKQIKHYLAEYPGEPVTVSQLCKITRVSIRTLQYAFLEHYGVTPKTYLKNFRLNNVRQELWKSDPDFTRVNNVANLWGFWHMGQFAADYRKLFDELPSETLRR
jgi:AraC family transcriptional regulator, ethanolamine operon transcriptional activator